MVDFFGTFSSAACPFTTFNEFPACPWHLRNSHPNWYPRGCPWFLHQTIVTWRWKCLLSVCTACPDTCLVYCMPSMLERASLVGGSFSIDQFSWQKSSLRVSLTENEGLHLSYRMTVNLSSFWKLSESASKQHKRMLAQASECFRSIIISLPSLPQWFLPFSVECRCGITARKSMEYW